MGTFRFWRRKKIFPGIHLNFSKSGMSVSFGLRGMKMTIGKSGIRFTTGISGTGLSYTSKKTFKKKNDKEQIEDKRKEKK